MEKHFTILLLITIWRGGIMQTSIKQNKWNRKRFITLSIVALVIIAACISYFLVFKSKAENSSSSSAKRTVQVTRGDIDVTLTGSGAVTSANTSDVMSNVQGKIT